MIDDKTIRRLERMNATVCFREDGDYVVTVSTGDGHRKLRHWGPESIRDKPVPPAGARIDHIGYFAQATGPDLPELVSVVFAAWVQERSAIVSLGELDDEDPA